VDFIQLPVKLKCSKKAAAACRLQHTQHRLKIQPGIPAAFLTFAALLTDELWQLQRNLRQQ
jgi:hypothetical protein